MPVKPEPSTRTLEILDSGASARTIPAQAVPCPETSPSVSSRDDLVVLADRDDDRALELADERMARLDARVEDADPHARAGRRRRRPSRA